MSKLKSILDFNKYLYVKTENNSLLEYPRILVLQTAFLGDVALSLHLMQFIKNYFKQHNAECYIVFITIPAWKDLVENCLFIDEVHYLDKKVKHKSILSTIKFAKKLDKKFKEQNKIPNCIISCHKSARTSILLSNIKAKMKIGFDNAKFNFIYNELVFYNKNLSEVQRNFQLLSFFSDFYVPISKEPQANKQVNKQSILNLDYKVGQNIQFDYSKSNQVISKFDLTDKKYICIAVGSVWATKKWRPSYFAELLYLILTNPKGGKKLDNLNICLIGGQQDLGSVEEVLQFWEKILTQVIISKGKEGVQDLRSRVVNLVGRTNLYENQIILSKSKFTITNDSAPTHLSELAGINVLTIFGPTSPKFGFAPQMKNSSYIEVDGLRCKPCHIHGQNVCPTGTHLCMKLLTPNLVYNKFVELFGRL